MLAHREASHVSSHFGFSHRCALPGLSVLRVLSAARKALQDWFVPLQASMNTPSWATVLSKESEMASQSPASGLTWADTNGCATTLTSCCPMCRAFYACCPSGHLTTAASVFCSCGNLFSHDRLHSVAQVLLFYPDGKRSSSADPALDIAPDGGAMARIQPPPPRQPGNHFCIFFELDVH